MCRCRDKFGEIEKKPILIASVGSLSGLLDGSKTNEVLYFYHVDHLGTPIMMTDSRGSKVWEAEYMPFGEPVSITGTVTNNLRVPGQYYDEETGNHYNYFRDYKPDIGRYLQRDPIGLVGGINLYAYVENNPLNNIDPQGLTVFPEDYYKFPPTGGWPPSEKSNKCLKCDLDALSTCLGTLPSPNTMMDCSACALALKNARTPLHAAIIASITPSCWRCGGNLAVSKGDCFSKYCNDGKVDECGKCQ